MKQQKLFSEKIVTEFGGNLATAKGRRKEKRPLVFSKPMHLILKTSKARGRFAFSPTDHRIKNLINRMGRKFGVKVYSTVQNWSHIHLVVRLPSRQAYQRFIRAVTGAMVLKLKASKGFFDLKPYTKVATWGRQFKTLKNYALKNELQAWGLSTVQTKWTLGAKKRRSLPCSSIKC